MVLVNAIYFLGKWRYKFDKDDTWDQNFTKLDKKSVKVPMMHLSKTFRYMEDDGFQAVEMMYRSSNMSMLIMLPKIDQFTKFESKLNPSVLKNIVDKLDSTEVELAIPKVKMEAQFSLSDQLKDMGMIDAFTDKADFSGMNGERNLFISKVIHKAFVDIDEEGTEAAAATAVVMSLMAMPDPEEPKKFIADHPFIFAIRDIKTGTILFLGRVMDPA